MHITIIVAKALLRNGTFSGALFLGISSLSQCIYRMGLHTSVVEVQCAVWNPTQFYLIDLIESVQRKFTKRIPSLSKLSYIQ
jgi:hypothetical protein